MKKTFEKVVISVNDKPRALVVIELKNIYNSGAKDVQRNTDYRSSDRAKADYHL